MKPDAFIRRAMQSEAQRGRQARYAAAYHTDLALITLSEFNYRDLFSTVARAFGDDSANNYSVFIHELTHFFQSIGTTYGIDRFILGLSDSSAIRLLLGLYRTSSPHNTFGKYLPFEDFAREEFLTLTRRATADSLPDMLRIEAHPVIYELLEYIAVAQTVREAFEGISPVSHVSPSWQWTPGRHGQYLTFVSPGPSPALLWTHLLLLASPEQNPFAVSIGARAIEESWAAAIQAIGLGRERAFPELWRASPQGHDYHSAFDYFEDHGPTLPDERAVPAFLACTDIALTYSGILEHGFFPVEQLPSVLTGDDVHQRMQPGRVLPRGAETHVATPAEVFMNAVQAARGVRGPSDDLARDLGRFMNDVIAAMGLPPMAQRIRSYLDGVLQPYRRKRKRHVQSFSHAVPDVDCATDYLLGLSEQALRTRLLYPDFFINAWNGAYRKRLAEAFRPLNVVDSSGETAFTLHRSEFLDDWFINQLLYSRRVQCPRVAFGLTVGEHVRCAIEEPFASVVSDTRRICDDHNYRDQDYLEALPAADCRFKALYHYYRLDMWKATPI